MKALIFMIRVLFLFGSLFTLEMKAGENRMDKQSLRKQAIVLQKSLDKSEKQQIEKKLTFHLLQSSLWKTADTIGITIAQSNEWDTKPIIEAAWKEGKIVAVPKCHPSTKMMTFYSLTSFAQLEQVYFGLLEPIPEETEPVAKKEMDLIIVPGLLFDRRGYRIGFGGGYYDRFLADFTNETVALASSSQVKTEIPNDPYDIPVNHIITENGLFRTKR